MAEITMQFGTAIKLVVSADNRPWNENSEKSTNGKIKYFYLFLRSSYV
jgi:hypothetical protein